MGVHVCVHVCVCVCVRVIYHGKHIGELANTVCFEHSVRVCTSPHCMQL